MYLAQRSGASATISIAWLSSRRSPASATSLRRRYQARPSSISALASSKNRTSIIGSDDGAARGPQTRELSSPCRHGSQPFSARSRQPKPLRYLPQALPPCPGGANHPPPPDPPPHS